VINKLRKQQGCLLYRVFIGECSCATARMMVAYRWCSDGVYSLPFSWSVTAAAFSLWTMLDQMLLVTSSSWCRTPRRALPYWRLDAKFY